MFRFSRRDLLGPEWVLERFFEILPGAVSWTVLVGMVVLSFSAPIVAACIVIAFDFYWLLRLFYMTLFLVLAYVRLACEEDTDWMARVRALADVAASVQAFASATPPVDFRRRLSEAFHRRQVTALARGGAHLPRPEEIYHLVIYPIARERSEVVRPGIESLAAQSFPPDRILVVLAVEERAATEVRRGAEELAAAYRGRFLDFLVIVHPDGLPGEARVKGANVTWAAKQAAAVLGDKAIPPEQVVVSCFDADTVVSPHYFACVTYHFLVTPDRNHASFQPIPVYHNNIWEAPVVSRVLDVGASFFQLMEATNPDKLVTFSSHSMSFRALQDVDYWPVDMISDDCAIFWMAFLHFGGRYRVVHMYITLSMDVVNAGSWWKTAAAVYQQKRRWAWGVENFPIVMRGFLHSRTIPLADKVRHGFKLFEGHVAWSTWAFLLTVISWLPALFAGREFSSSVLYYSAPRVTGIIFNLSSLALLTTMILNWLLLPKRGTSFSIFKRVLLALEWLFVPFIFTCLSAVPALDAQTRLALGRYMEFSVTEKRRSGLEPKGGEVPA